MGYIGNRLADSYTSFAKQDFTTSATTNYVLDQAVTNANEIALFINFVRQEPTTAYTASGTTLTLTSATTAGDDMYCIFLGKAVQTVNPPAGSVGTSQLADTSVTSAKISYPLTTFSSTGIDDNATSTAITIDSNKTSTLQCSAGDSNFALLAYHPTSTATRTIAKFQSNVGGTQEDKVVIQTSGNVGIGTASPGDKLDVNGKILSTSLDVSGTLRAAKDGASFDAQSYHQIIGATSTFYTLKILNQASSPSVEYITEVSFASGSPDSSGAKFFQMRDSTTARVNINSDGDLQNHDNSYGAISDERIKQNIVDAGSQWEDIKNIRVRKYKKKDDVLQYGEANAPIELGVISQELETVSPGLIKEDKPDISHVNMHPDFTGDNPQNVKYVKYSILYMKAIKALQEAMERIETLEAKVTALENA